MAELGRWNYERHINMCFRLFTNEGHVTYAVNKRYSVNDKRFVHLEVIHEIKSPEYYIINNRIKLFPYSQHSNSYTTIYSHSILAFARLDSPAGSRPPSSRGFEVTLRHTTLSRTPLNEWSAHCRDLCVTTHNTHKRQISMPSAGFETKFLADERPYTHPLDRAAIGIGCSICRSIQIDDKSKLYTFWMNNKSN